jgi:hypothetical protein
MKKKSKRRAGSAPTMGPVTLDEALALAAARAPRKAIRRGPVMKATPATVGQERQDLEKAEQRERQRREDEYKAAMQIMKKHGAAAAPEKARRRAAGAAKTISKPLQIFAEGDSWFDYPVPLFGGGVIKRLQRRIGIPILNLATAGDEVRFMLGVKERRSLIEQLTNGCPAGGPWDALLFSGGGNDIVDNPMVLWINDFNTQLPPAEHINQPRFDTALALVRYGYEDLIALRDKLCPTTKLILHAYDFAIPDGRGICNHGPWLQPTFKMRKIVNQSFAFDVVKAMLQQFAALLQALASNHPNVDFINAQGTLAPVKASWHNELHPEKKGFERFADIFHTHLRTQFPDKVF